MFTVDMKLSQWAKKQGVCYRTAWNLYKAGKIPEAYSLPSGTIIIPEQKIQVIKEYNVIYARVSSSENKNNLESQAKRIYDFCIARGWQIDEIIKECASGLNDSRPKLQKILKEQKATRIIVEHKDRLTRFGFEYLKTLFKGEIFVINVTSEEKQDLMQDFVSLVTSFCARLYGQRRSKRKTEQLIEELKK